MRVHDALRQVGLASGLGCAFYPVDGCASYIMGRTPAACAPHPALPGEKDTRARTQQRPQPAKGRLVPSPPAQGLAAAAALHGPAFQAAMARLDPLLAAQVAAAVEAGGPGRL